jgi:hypothetical protein
VLDRGGKVFKQSAPVIKLPEGASVEAHLRLLGVLNSSAACFWLKQNSHNKGQHRRHVRCDAWVECAPSRRRRPRGLLSGVTQVRHTEGAYGRRDLVKAHVGDWLVIKGTTIDRPDQRGLITEVHSADGSPPYVVRWIATGHEATVYPGPDSVIVTPEEQQAADERTKSRVASVQKAIRRDT